MTTYLLIEISPKLIIIGLCLLAFGGVAFCSYPGSSDDHGDSH